MPDLRISISGQNIIGKASQLDGCFWVVWVVAFATIQQNEFCSDFHSDNGILF